MRRPGHRCPKQESRRFIAESSDSQSDSSNSDDDDDGIKRERNESGSHRENNIRQRLEDVIDENAEEEQRQVFLQRLNPHVLAQATEKVAKNRRNHTEEPRSNTVTKETKSSSRMKYSNCKLN
eukprot:2990842-Amphidinium_carterae.1